VEFESRSEQSEKQISHKGEKEGNIVKGIGEGEELLEGI
jgi:hypothetical protein